MAKHICLFGGPGTGKSTTAARLFFEMKKLGIKCEYSTEVAKDWVYSKKFFELSDQLLVLARSHHNWYKLDKVVDYVIHDGPFLNTNVYITEVDKIPVNTVKQLTLDLFNNYDTLNIFLTRDLNNHPYQKYGRTQTLEEAQLLDCQIKTMLNNSKIKYTELLVSDNAWFEIFDLLKVNKLS